MGTVAGKEKEPEPNETLWFIEFYHHRTPKALIDIKFYPVTPHDYLSIRKKSAPRGEGRKRGRETRLSYSPGAHRSLGSLCGLVGPVGRDLDQLVVAVLKRLEPVVHQLELRLLL